jgi:acetyl esterase/lipase
MVVTNRALVSLTLLCAWATTQAQNAKPFDAASAFGARPSVMNLTLSPNGTSVAYMVPIEGEGAVVYTLSLAKGSTPKRAFAADGKSYRLLGCEWVANDRLACRVYSIAKDPTVGLLPVTRVWAINADGSNLRELSTRSNANTRGFNLWGGGVLDWLPDEDGAVLMVRNYVPEDHAGTRLASSGEGLAVDRIDTRTLAVSHIEPPRREAVGYVTDGHGTVRVMAVQTMHADQQSTGVIIYLYRLPGSREWKTLTTYNEADYSGFELEAVDRDLNVAYGFKKKDGRNALYSIALDESKREELIYARPDVDVSHLIRIGRRERVVGASYVLDTRKAHYFATDIAAMTTSLAKALPPPTVLKVTDSSVDETKMLILAGSDKDPGVYYIFDRPGHHLDTFLVVRSQLEGVTLASVKPINYPATDGTLIPGYLTLPPGHEDAKGLPAIVMPHGGPSARDEWGFDWLAQFYASRGYAVLQPNFRGSSGYGDTWFQDNGFRSWPVAIGDVLDAGRWLVHEGIADPGKLAIVGWSYGGYAALQAAVVDPSVFKAVVAIAPVTDLPALKEEHRNWSDFELVSQFVGSGPHTHEGSPAEQANKIKVPVMLFHGALDRNVSIEQSRLMAGRLTAAGGKCELITWDDLDHYLDDANARTQLLRRSDEFLRQALGL